MSNFRLKLLLIAFIILLILINDVVDAKSKLNIVNSYLFRKEEEGKDLSFGPRKKFLEKT